MNFKGYLLTVTFLWVEAMAFFPFIFVRRNAPDANLINHECIHLRQQLEMGLLLFYIWYLVEYLIRLIRLRRHHQAYMQISFEREAYQHQGNLGYLKERKVWAFLKYV